MVSEDRCPVFEDGRVPMFLSLVLVSSVARFEDVPILDRSPMVQRSGVPVSSSAVPSEDRVSQGGGVPFLCRVPAQWVGGPVSSLVVTFGCREVQDGGVPFLCRVPAAQRQDADSPVAPDRSIAVKPFGPVRHFAFPKAERSENL